MIMKIYLHSIKHDSPNMWLKGFFTDSIWNIWTFKFRAPLFPSTPISFVNLLLWASNDCTLYFTFIDHFLEKLHLLEFDLTELMPDQIKHFVGLPFHHQKILLFQLPVHQAGVKRLAIHLLTNTKVTWIFRGLSSHSKLGIFSWFSKWIISWRAYFKLIKLIKGTILQINNWYEPN